MRDLARILSRLLSIWLAVDRALLVAAALIWIGLAGTSHALSTLNAPPAAPDSQKAASPPANPILPAPDPMINSSQKPANPDSAPQEEEPAGNGQPEMLPAKPSTKNANIEVLRDIEKAPPAVRKMRERIVEAAASGDPARLVELMGSGSGQTQLAQGEPVANPLQTIKDMSGDPDGIEVLAAVLNIMSTGFVHINAGTPDELYVWPYFAEKPMKALTPPEKVELMRMVTSGDFSDMQEYDGYNYLRIGISPNGQWKYMLTDQ